MGTIHVWLYEVNTVECEGGQQSCCLLAACLLGDYEDYQEVQSSAM